MITGSSRWYTVGGHLVTAVRTGLTNEVTRYGQVPGEVAWDECCGMLAVTVPRVYLSEEFPDEVESTLGAICQPPYEVAEFTVTVLRCAPTSSSDGTPPSAADLDTSAALLLQDTAETMSALTAKLCSLKDADSISDYLVTPAQPQGPEGGCVGLNVQVRISLERL